jgi:hypothetical protein
VEWIAEPLKIRPLPAFAGSKAAGACFASWGGAGAAGRRNSRMRFMITVQARMPSGGFGGFDLPGSSAKVEMDGGSCGE